MDNKDFQKRFTNERSRINTLEQIQDKANIFSSREWLFYEKFKWWNYNIKAVLDCSNKDSFEYATLYNNYCEEYCQKFKVDIMEFVGDKAFFDDLLSEVYVDANGDIHTEKYRVGKPRKRKYCSACGSSVKYYVNLPNGRILCKMCEEQLEAYQYLEFEKKWEA